MNVSLLHAVTEEFAAYLSEVTDADFERPTPCTGWTVGDLCHHVVEENAKFGHAVSGLRVPFAATAESLQADDQAPPRLSGREVEAVYRASARYMEDAFARVDDPEQPRQVAGVPGERRVADLYEMQLTDTLIHTWDLTRSVELDYTHQPEVAELVLNRMRSVPDSARGEGRPFRAARTVPDAAELTTLDRIVLLSGRDIAWRPGPRQPDRSVDD